MAAKRDASRAGQKVASTECDWVDWLGMEEADWMDVQKAASSGHTTDDQRAVSKVA